MLEPSSDSIWQIIGIISAILAPLWIYWLGKKTKEIAFGLVSSRRLLSVADELSSRVTVNLDGRAVRDLHLVVYGLKNSGHFAINASDFDRPISLSFDDGQIVSAQISSQFPANLDASLIVNDANVQLEPLLMNPGDYLLIQVLLSAPKPIARLNGRIVGISSFTQLNNLPKLPKFHQSGLFLLTTLSLIIAGLLHILRPGDGTSLAFLGLAAFSVVFGLTSRVPYKIGASARRRIDEI